MDASTSTIFLKLVGHTKILGDFVVYTAGNFRDGSNKGFQLRNAYVSFRDVTVGYTYGGFMDAVVPDGKSGAGHRVFDGVEVDKNGRVVAYYISNT